MQVYTLINGATGTGAGSAQKVDHQRCLNGGPIPLLLSGITTATVILEATIATDVEVSAGTAAWSPVVNASWTADMADGLFTGFTHIRGNVTSYSAGTIYLKALI
jgi:hypothetical protein